MLIWLIFLFFVCFSVHSQRFILPAFFSIVTCLPYYVRLGPISLFAGICLFIYCYGVVSKYRIETFFVNKWIKYFLLYYVGSRVMIALLGEQTIPLSQQISHLKGVIPLIAICPIFYLGEKGDCKYVYKCFRILCFVVCLYGVYAYSVNSNPYLEYISQYFDDKIAYLESANRFINEERGGLHGRLSGITFNPIQYGILLVVLGYIPLFNIIVRKQNNLGDLFVIILIFLNMFLTGSRGPLFAFFFPVLFLFLSSLPPKRRLLFLFIVGVLMVSIIYFPVLEKYAPFVKSFILIFDSSSSDAANINGSSVEGRLGQLIATIFLINLNVKTFLFGHGYGYVAYFLENGEKNALTGEFEGELLSSLLSYGIIGTIIIMLLSYYFCFYLVFYLYRKQQITMEAKTFLVLYIISKFLFSFLVGAASEHLWYICFLFFCAQSIFINKKNV